MAAQPAFTRSRPAATGAASAAERHEPTAPDIKPLAPTGRFAPSVRRLVALIPDADTDETQLARQLWTMAARNELPVLLLGLSRDAKSELRARRRLATIAALARDARVHVDARLETRLDWIKAARSMRRNSDLVVCHSEQQVVRRGFRREPLSRLLMAAFNEPVCVLSGFYPGLPPDRLNPAGRWIAAAVPFIIFAGFTALQVLIHQTTKATANTLLMAASVIVEYGLIGLWHYLFI